MSKDNTDKDCKTKKEPVLGTILDKNTETLRNVVFTLMKQNGIPASLMDYILTSILSEVRDLKSKEYASCLIKEE